MSGRRRRAPRPALAAAALAVAAATRVLAVVTPAPLSAQERAALSPEQTARIDSAVAAAVAAHEVVGLQVAVGIGDDVAWTKGYGAADLEHDAPVGPDTRFRTASISKWMTATAAMRLAEEGRLDLDAPVQRYCPAYPDKRWPLATRHLLGHRGGVRHYWGANGEPRESLTDLAALAERAEEEERWMKVRYTEVVRPLDRFKDDPLLFEPGTGYRYSSHGYRLVGCVVQGAAGKPYAEVMEDLVFGPAGMASTGNDDAWAIVPGRARGYTRAPDGSLRRSSFRDVSENLPAGGHFSTAADLVRFALAWWGGELVSPETRDAMTAPEPGEDAAEGYYGYGVNVLRVEELGGRLVLNHSGGQDETRTLLVLLPEEEVAVALMTNDEPFAGTRQRDLIAAILGILLEP